MPPRITVVRHAQGFHNETRNYNLHDPLLTKLGREECARLSASYPHHDTVNLILVSPLRRTIQTAAFSFGPALAREDVPFVLDSRLQEVSGSPADTGMDVQDLKRWLRDVAEGEGKGKAFGFDWGKINDEKVHEGWNNNQGYWAYEHSTISNRATEVRESLFQRPEGHIVVVTHGAFAHFLTEDWDVEDPMLQTTWTNCEAREYVFNESSKIGNAHLVETKESRSQRGIGEEDQHVVEELEGVVESIKTGP